MAGTDRTKHTEAAASPAPTVVLVAPQMGENIGAAARAMLNFGLERMRLVSPRDGWPNPRASAMASGAGRVLDQAQVFASTAEACSDLSLVFATTARGRELTKRVLTPEQAMTEARAMVSAGERVGVLFGPERAGLETADVVRASAIVSIPVNPGFASLNLAQSVLLMAYEWQRSGARLAPEPPAADTAARATGTEVDRFLEHLRDRLDAIGFFFPAQKRAHMLANLENLFRRAPLTGADVRTLHGVIRALAEKMPGRK